MADAGILSDGTSMQPFVISAFAVAVGSFRKIALEAASPVATSAHAARRYESTAGGLDHSKEIRGDKRTLDQRPALPARRWSFW